MIFTRIKRGATRSAVVIGLKFERFARTPLRTTLKMVRNTALKLLVLPVITLQIPVAHAAAPAALMTEDADPSSTIPLIVAGHVSTSVTFSQSGLEDRNASPFIEPEYRLADVAVGTSYATQAEQEAAQAAAAQAAAEAAAKATQSAAAKAAAAKAAQQARALATVPDTGTVENIAYQITVAEFDASQWPAMEAIISRESGFDPYAENSSGAYGLGQALPGYKMAAYGSDYLTNPKTQMQWMASYISDRYGTPDNALAFWNAHRWY